MNRDEAKEILITYRHGTADAADPQIAEALAVAKNDSDLAGWLEMHCARQFVLSEKFRQIVPPAGLKEQIISEHAVNQKAPSLLQRDLKPLPVLALLLILGLLGATWFGAFKRNDTLTIYRSQMATTAMWGYDMTLATNDLHQIRDYLAANQAPANFTLPAGLQKSTLTGCAVAAWHKTKVALICFRTGEAAANSGNNLWLFVVDQASVHNLPKGEHPEIASVNGMITASWVKDGKLYLLGTLNDEQTLKLLL